MADVRIQQYPLKNTLAAGDLILIADSADVDVNGFLKYKKVEAQTLASALSRATTVTYAELDALVTDSELIQGSFYIISDAVSSTLSLLVQAADNNTVSVLAINTVDGTTYTYDFATDTGIAGFVSSRVDFTAQSAPAYLKGRMWYDSTNETVSFYDDINGTSVQVAQENILRARNSTGSTILNGQVVYVSGAQGQNARVSLAQANAESTSRVIGVATHDIANNSIGKICTFGLVNELNTQAYNEGDILYLSATVAGAFTTTRPSTPNQVVAVATVLHSGNNDGKILVHPSNYAPNYEEGTFTPVITVNGTTNGVGQNIFQGFYTRIGDEVFVQMNIGINATAMPTGVVRITGLPYASKRQTALNVYPTIGSGFANNNFKQAITDTNSTGIFLTDNYSEMTNTSLNNSMSFRINGTYKIN